MGKFFKLEFYVPLGHEQKVKDAVFAAGAGRLGNYDCCAWECSGNGQFRPCAGSTPFIGETGKVEKVPELKVEMICSEDKIRAVIDALIAAHPYETPAFQYWEVNIK
jgi:hypothetical protein